MKRFLCTIGAAIICMSCGNSNTSSEPVSDSLRNVQLNADSLKQEQIADSIHSMEKGAVSTLDSANKRIENANQKISDSIHL